MRNIRVVIIDDDMKSLGYLEEILAAVGHDSVVVNDALSAVDMVVQNQPDLILLELKMPYETGFEFADELSLTLKTQRIPIVAMSSFLKDEFCWLSDLYGIKKWIKKPFQPLDVIWAIESEIEDGDQWLRKDRLADMEFAA